MNWYTLFRQHILDRGSEYCEDGRVVDFNYSDDEIIAQVDGTDVYDVQNMLDGEEVIDMYCSCPYAADGRNCKHMAAVLFKFEEILYEKDVERRMNDIDEDCSSPMEDFYQRHQREKAELESFLNTKVKLLIDKKCLKQAFELTNLVFHCIGNIDMDDSDGGSIFVANACYECWERIAVVVVLM